MLFSCYWVAGIFLAIICKNYLLTFQTEIEIDQLENVESIHSGNFIIENRNMTVKVENLVRVYLDILCIFIVLKILLKKHALGFLLFSINFYV